MTVAQLESLAMQYASEGKLYDHILIQMWAETDKLLAPKASIEFYQRLSQPASMQRRVQPKTYREIPTLQAGREVLNDFNIGECFYVRCTGNYTAASLQARLIGLGISWNLKYKDRRIFETHKVGNEIKVTRVA